MGDSDGFEFVCRECGQEIEVNASMREALLVHGCVICGAVVTDESFS